MSLNGAAIDRSFGKIFKPFSYSGPNVGADFVLRFPRHLDVKMKATVLGACILIVNIVFVLKYLLTTFFPIVLRLANCLLFLIITQFIFRTACIMKGQDKKKL